MKNQKNQPRRLLLLTILAAIVLLGTSFTAFAQDWGATGYNSYVARAIRQQSMDRAIRRQASRSGNHSRRRAAHRSTRRHRRA